MIDDPAIDAISAMEFVGPITPGGPDVILSGSAKDIYEQIIELNPSYDVFEFPDYVDALESQGINRENFETADLTTRNPSVAARDALAKRDGVSSMLKAELSELRLIAPIQINCNVGTWIGNVHTQCTEGLIYLRRLGRARCGAKPRSCARVSCSNHCGMYYCSKVSSAPSQLPENIFEKYHGNLLTPSQFNKEIKAYCTDIASDIQAIVGKCGHAYNDWILEARGRKAFTDHNVELSSASC